MLPARDELLQGDSKTYSFYLPERLVRELDRAAGFDGVKSRGQYVALLLTAALRLREAERVEEAAAKRR